MNATPVLLSAAVLLVGAAAGYVLLREEPQTALPAAPSVQPAPPAPAPIEPAVAPAAQPWTVHEQPVLTDKPLQVPLHKKSQYPPYTVIPISQVPRVRDGIRLPDGSKIPFLNGITAAPELQRDPRYGPVGEIVSLSVDGEGFEWWWHADGSATTTRYKKVVHLGQTYWDVATEHLVPTPNQNIRVADLPPTDPEAPPRNGRK